MNPSPRFGGRNANKTDCGVWSVVRRSSFDWSASKRHGAPVLIKMQAATVST